MFIVVSIRVGCQRVSGWFDTPEEAAAHADWLIDLGHYGIELIKVDDY